MSGETEIRGVPETMLQTLYARAAETESGRGLIRDEMAVDIVRKLDYGFSMAARDKTMSTGVVARTILLDRMTEQFLSEHPETTVINIACGLDTRCYRLTSDYRHWYNLDLEETMKIRRRFMSETEKISQIRCSAMDPAWTQQVSGIQGQVLVIIEGLTMYLSEKEVKQIFSLIETTFEQVTVFTEVMNPWVVGHVREKSIEGSAARFSWGIRGKKQMEALIPAFHCIDERSLVEGMQEFIPVYKLLGKISFIRNISNKILVMKK